MKILLRRNVQYIQKLSTYSTRTQFKTLTDLHALLEMLYTGKPTAAVVSGQCLGGGLELILAAHFRIAVQSSPLRIGLPEVRIGIIPGLGGTQRLPRLVGLEHALPMLLKGEIIGTQQAEKIGLIDESTKTKSQAMQKAVRYIKKNTIRKENTINPYDSLQTFSAAIALSKKQTQGCYPHIQTLLQAIYEGGLVERTAALEVETHLFIKTLESEQSKRMLHTLFLAPKKLKQMAREYAKKYPICHIGIIGGGFMGSAIAAHALQSGIDVTIIEQTHELQACAARIKQLRAQYPTNMHKAKLKISTQYTTLSHTELVIEAIFENITQKQVILQEVEQHVSKDCIIASNTSSIPISLLAKSLSNPDRFVGIHFFSPVAKMQLVEIIKGRHTKRLTVAKAQALTSVFNKVAICIKDTPGFYTTNIAMAYADTALKLLASGAAHYIETAATRIGMPTPPLKLMDEIGIDVIWSILEAKQQYAKTSLPKHTKLLENMFTRGRLGRKNKAGFYDYDKGKCLLWAELSNQKHISNLSIEEIESRLYNAQTSVAKQLVDMGIVDPVSANVGAVFGLGFCPWSGGPI